MKMQHLVSIGSLLITAVSLSIASPGIAFAGEPPIIQVKPSDEAAVAARPQSNPCHVFAVKPGYGVRAPGQPAWNSPSPRPDCDIASPNRIAAPDAASIANSKGAVNTAATDLNDHGGPRITAAASHFLYLNGATDIYYNNPSPHAFIADLFATTQYASDMWRINDQFIGTTANGFTVGRTGFTTYPNLPHTMTEAQIQTAIRSGIVYFFPNGGGGGTGNNYHLFLEAGQDTCFASNTSQCYSPDNLATHAFCAYHTYYDTTDANGASIRVYYSVEPRQGVTGCTVSGGPNSSLIDSTNNVLSHEVFELVTDPALNAWYRTSDGQEIGDICNFNESNMTLNGNSYRLQKEYSNADHACSIGVGAPINPPSNDNFTNATTFTLSATTVGTNQSATQENGEPNINGNLGGKSVWWKFTPTVSGKVNLSTYASSFDTLLGVYTGNAVNALTQVAINDDCPVSGTGTTSCLTINVVAGTQYYVAVDGYYNAGSHGTASGTVALYISLVVTPSMTHDFQGDARSDILWRSSTGDIAEWTMNGPTVTHNYGLGSISTNWSIVGLRNFDGNGNGADSGVIGLGTSDILWRDTSGNIAIWTMYGQTVTHNYGLGNIPTNWSVAGTGDFDGDGKGDILWRDTSGNIVIWTMSGPTVTHNYSLGNIPTNWSVVGTGDFDGDGISDILWRDTSGNIAIWTMNGPTVTHNYGLGNIPTNWSVAGTGDFNGDSRADILWRDTSGNIAIWTMNGQTVTHNYGLGNIPTNWSVAVTGDFDGDGSSDILWRDTSGNIQMWIMQNGNTVAHNYSIGSIPTNWTVQSAGAE